MPVAGLMPLPIEQLHDWFGEPISKEHIRKLMVDCTVRVIIGRKDVEGWEALYFRITKIKDRTFWGVCQDTYRINNYIGLASGETMTFCKEHISEIPMGKLWQPKAYRKAIDSIGNMPTGLETEDED